MRFMILAMLALIIFELHPVAAETAEAKGTRIMAAAYAAVAGFGRLSADVTKTVRYKNGETDSRRFRETISELKDGGRESVVVFTHPRNIAGVTLTTVTARDGNPEQWIYLPALGRTVSADRVAENGVLMGPDLDFLDPLRMPLNHFSYTWLRDEKCAHGEMCWVIEAVSKRGVGDGGRRVIWLNRTRHWYHKIILYDRAGGPLATVRYAGHKVWDGNHWRPTNIAAIDHRSKRRTRFSVSVAPIMANPDIPKGAKRTREVSSSEIP